MKLRVPIAFPVSNSQHFSMLQMSYVISTVTLIVASSLPAALAFVHILVRPYTVGCVCNFGHKLMQ